MGKLIKNDLFCLICRCNFIVQNVRFGELFIILLEKALEKSATNVYFSKFLKTMKKTILSFLFSLFVASWSYAGVEEYSVQSNEIDALFASSEDITASLANQTDLQSISAATQVSDDDKSVGGFLIRSFFCGGIALHRYYMGTNGKSMWWKYLCIPFAGAIANCGDFFWVLFEGEKALNKYKNNGAYFVW